MGLNKKRNSLKGVYALVGSAEAKGPYFYDHSRKVKTYAVALAEGVGLSPDQVANVSTAALLHDIGKIGVPDKVLNKKGKLNDEDWKAIKTHPKLGATIVGNVPNLAPCANIVLHHHEKWDGSGYPEGLRGEQIPTEARIIAIAESFAAMTSTLPYRPAFSLEETIKELRKGAGSQFDPKLVDPFIEIVQRVGTTPENVFKEWEKHGISVTELEDVVEVRRQGEVVARFFPLVPFEILREEVQKIIEENINPERSPGNEQRRIDSSGAELGEEGEFRSSCGTRVSEMDPESTTQVKYPHQVATVLGYVFGFLGGWLGLVFGIYLVTREHWRAKDQGKIILSVSVVMTILWMFILLD